MKRSKKLYTLLGVLVVVCAITFGVTRYEEEKEQIKNSDEIILELDCENVTKLSWEYEGESLAFHKDESWVYDEDDAFPVSEEKVGELLEIFESFGVSFIIEEVEDFGQYGLDNPECTINIETEDDTYEIKLGDFSSMDSERYVSIDDGNVYLVKEDPMESFEITLKDMIDNDEAPDFEQVNQIQFEGEAEYEVVYDEENEKAYSEEDIYFTDVDGESVPLDTNLTESYLSTISGLSLTEYETYNVTDEELATYGLDQPELTVTVQYSWEDEDEEMQEDTFTLSISQDPEEKKNTKKSEDSEEEDEEEEEITAYARVGESKIIYKITGEEYEALMAGTLDDLRYQEVIPAAFSEIEEINISLEGKEYTITSKGKDDDKTFLCDDEEIEIADFQSALESMTAESFTDETPTEKEEISMTISLDNENHPEIKVELYRYDGDSCLAVVDGKPLSLVSRSSVVDLVEAVNAIVLN